MEKVNRFKTTFDRHKDILEIIQERAVEVTMPELDANSNYKFNNSNNNSPLKKKSFFYKIRQKLL